MRTPPTKNPAATSAGAGPDAWCVLEGSWRRRASALRHLGRRTRADTRVGTGTTSRSAKNGTQVEVNVLTGEPEEEVLEAAPSAANAPQLFKGATRDESRPAG